MGTLITATGSQMHDRNALTGRFKYAMTMLQQSGWATAVDETMRTNWIKAHIYGFLAWAAGNVNTKGSDTAT